ncbi:hypothetical protein AWENTII_001225 [Aspergillus wentii]
MSQGVEPFGLQSEAVSDGDLLLDLGPESSRGDLLEREVALGVDLPQRSINLCAGARVDIGTQQAVQQVRHSRRNKRCRHVAEVLVGNVLEGTSNHLLDHDGRQCGKASTLLLRQVSQLTKVTDVDTALVQELAQRLAVHREANISIMEVLNQFRHNLGPQEVTSLTDFLLVTGPLCLLLIGLGNLATADIGVEGKLESGDVNTLLILGLFFLLFGALLLRFGIASLLLSGLFLSLGGAAALDLSLDILAHLVSPVGLDKLQSQDRHTVRVDIATFFLLPHNIERSHAVQVQNVLTAIGTQQTLCLNATFEVMTLAILVPDRVALDAKGLGKLLENGSEIGVGCDHLLAFNTTVVDLVLTGLTLLEDAGHDTLANDTLAEVVDDNSSGSKQAVDIQLVHSLNSQNVLADGHASGLIATLGSESTDSIGTEGVEDVVVHEDLSVTVLRGVQRCDLTACDQDGTTGSSLVVISKQLIGQALSENTVLNSFARQLAGSLEFLVPIAQGLRIVNARDQVVLLRTGDVGLMGIDVGGRRETSHGLLGMAFWKGKVVRRSFWLLDSCRASNAELKEGDNLEIKVSSE